MSSFREYQKKWVKNNRKKMRLTAKRYRERLKLDPVRLKALKEKSRAQNLKYNFNITIDDYNQMKVRQNFSCAICKKSEDLLTKPLHVDHCHKTKAVRGLLCSRCNLVLGQIDDNKDLLYCMVEYLKEYEGVKKLV